MWRGEDSREAFVRESQNRAVIVSAAVLTGALRS
jgi:hypothetical protein